MGHRQLRKPSRHLSPRMRTAANHPQGLAWRGRCHPQPHLPRRIAPTYEAVAALAAEVDVLLRSEGWPEESAGAAQLVAMEHGANVVDYGRLAPGDGLDFRLRLSPGGAQLLFRDPGREWDFAERLAYTERQPLDSERGRGLQIIQAISSRVDLTRADGLNTSCYYISRSFRAERPDQKGVGS